MLTAAFLLGFTGSFHCVGMCGPLAMQVRASAKQNLLINRILYNIGRILTYCLLGLSAGMVGQVIKISGLQGWLSIILGLLTGSVLVFSRIEKWIVPKTFSAVSTLKQGISKFIQRKSSGAALLMGALNGLLPCGLVYAAVVISLVQADWLNSVLVMVLFGLGTVPAMLLAAWSYTKVVSWLPVSPKKVQLFVVGLMALILIWRGISMEGLFSIDRTPLCYPLH